MIAIASRVMQFRAGPGSYTFYACADCQPDLERGEAGGGNFFTTAAEPVRAVDPDDDIIECDLCREPGDPDGEAYRGGEAAAAERDRQIEAQRLK